MAVVTAVTASLMAGLAGLAVTQATVATAKWLVQEVAVAEGPVTAILVAAQGAAALEFWAKVQVARQASNPQALAVMAQGAAGEAVELLVKMSLLPTQEQMEGFTGVDQVIRLRISCQHRRILTQTQLL
jgi:hypothetical protein